MKFSTFLFLLSFTPPLSAGLLDDVVNTGVKIASSQKQFSTEEEIDMGRRFSAMVLGAYPASGSETLNQYVTKVGLTIAAVSERPNLVYHFQIVDAKDSQGNDIVNAFSTPGGFIFITRGVLVRLKSEAELAGVLAHEVAHVAQKHVLKAINNQKVTAALTELGSQAVAEHTGGIAQQFSSVIGPALVENVFEKGLDKGDEYRADAAAVRYASKAGYDPRGLIGLLKTIQSREGKVNYSTLFRTHPKPEDRIARIENEINSKKLANGKKQVLAERLTQAGLF